MSMRRIPSSSAAVQVLCLVAALAALPTAPASAADGPSSLFRYPDISRDSIVFVYANDLWIVSRTGGEARPLASPPGSEVIPRFSPDGSKVAFMGNYGGGRDLYVISVRGGVPQRATHHPGTELLTEWTSDDRLVFASNDLGGLTRATTLWTVPSSGGLPTQLPVPYGANGTISRDGAWLAYTPHSIDNRTWKRYRGGMQTDIWLYNLSTGASRKITDWEGIDTLPMWHGEKVYYLSDEGEGHRLNIWLFDTATGERRRITNFTDFDVKWPAIGPDDGGPGEIVFQHASSLKVLDLATETVREVEVTVPGDTPKIMTQTVEANQFLQGAAISPTGKRVVVEARGDIWTAPAENGTPRNLTRTSGIAERDPAWSPDGRLVAYFSDEPGEYELFVRAADGRGEARRVTTDGTVFRTGIIWSPDSKKVVIGDKTGAIQLVDIESGAVSPIDRNPWNISMGPVSWSSDSRWLAYARGSDENRTQAVFLFDTKTGERHQVTAGMFNDANPTFDRKGDWLVFTSDRSFNPRYSALDTTWIYDEASVLVAVPLRTDVKLAWLPTSDEEEVKDERKSAEKKDEKKGDDAKPEDGADNGKDAAPAADSPAGVWSCTTRIPEMGELQFTLTISVDAANKVTGSLASPVLSGAIEGTWTPATKTLDLTLSLPQGGSASMRLVVDGDTLKGEGVGPTGQTTAIEGKRESKGDGGDAAGDEKTDKPAKEGGKEILIELDGFESRAIRLPVPNGNYGSVGFNDKNQVVYGRGGSIHVLDLGDRKREEKRVGAGGRFQVSADGKKLLVGGGGGLSILDASPNATPKAVVTTPMLVEIDPRAEWRQMFRDSWRIMRDYFYEPTMHGVDWEAVYEQYAPLVEHANAREDLSYLISEMISELNVGHAYYQGGDIETAPSRNVGLLGVDFSLDGTDDARAYRIARIHGGGPWDLDARGPLSAQGIDVKVGDYLLAVNGVPIDTSRDPWAAFVGLAGRPVTLTVGDNPTMDHTVRHVVVETITSESGLRYRGWIERNRAYVAEKTGGKVGYIYVPNTGVDGQTDLVRQFQGQRDLPALIIDERWNGGGQIPSRFIEMLNRPATNFWARRDTRDWIWPPDSHQGPKAMLINGLAGSGGDMFPWLFRHHKLGPLVGTRTWGGLVGISGNPALIDNGRVSVPTFGFYELDGTWGIEGHGVDPDYEVLDDPALMRDGGDPQLDKAIELMLEALRERPFVPAQRPASPDRSGMGIDPRDK
jgi:tricorn protease-like protein/C-terminal processing protease CtpA/Prc